MTNSPSPEPKPPQKSPLGFDEFISIFVAFSAIGGIFFWVLSHKNEGFKFPPLVTVPLTPVNPTIEQQIPPTATKKFTPKPLVPSTPINPTRTQGKFIPPSSFSTPAQPVPGVSVKPVAPVPLPIFPHNQSATTQTPLAKEVKPKTPLVAPLIIPISPKAGTSIQPRQFSDVPPNFWAYPFIQELQKRTVINGFSGGYFRPNQPLTRAEFAALLQTAFNQKAIEKAENFKDVSSDFWAFPAITEATRAGFVEGFPDNNFRPKQTVTKTQVIIALAKGLNLKTTANPTKTLEVYKDAADIPAYARNAIAAATEAGLVVNYPNSTVLNPRKSATRAEVSALIYQALVKTRKAKTVPSKYIVQPK